MTIPDTHHKSCARLCVLLALLLFSLSPASIRANETADSTSNNFVVAPYLQLGDRPSLTDPESLTLLWQTIDSKDNWSVQVKDDGARRWKSQAAPKVQSVELPGNGPRCFFTGQLTGLAPGKPFDYRLLRNDAPVFEAHAQARKAASQPYRFVVVGDCGTNSAPQRQVANQIYSAKPDFVMVPGDIVYNNGRLSEYMHRYFPIYNSEQATPDKGAPLIRSTVFVAAAGNHDIDVMGRVVARDLDLFPDGLGYFYLWSQPLNGPPLVSGQANTPKLIGLESHQSRFLKLAGPRYPRMANFSFDYGNAHIVVLDANQYMDWLDPKLRTWLEDDLASANNAKWRFVCFHQPGFNSDLGHFIEQRMRLLSDIFERQKVDVVFNGHTHNYQRSYPLHFVPAKRERAKPGEQINAVPGTWTLDRAFDGVTNTHPDGVLYIVSGAGGAGLTGTYQAGNQSTWQEFTFKFIAPPHSFTTCDVNDKTLIVRQLSADGDELDRFTITK
jgi:predicted phosphodiesterase